MIDWTDAPPFGRTVPLMATLQLVANAYQNRAPADGWPVIVEVGTTYANDPVGNGAAGLAFSWYANKYGAHFVSVDVDHGAIVKSREVFLTAGLGIPEFVCADARLALPLIRRSSAGTKPIALLYLDAMWQDVMDVAGVNDKHNGWYVEVLEHLVPALAPGSLVLFDDAGFESNVIGPPGGPWVWGDIARFTGKGETAIPWLLARNWRLCFEAFDFWLHRMALLEMR